MICSNFRHYAADMQQYAAIQSILTIALLTIMLTIQNNPSANFLEDTPLG